MEKKRIIGIYLAAGNSRRFGKRKTEQLIWRRPLASIALSTILKSEIDFTIAICSAADKLNWITPEIHETYLEKWRKVVCTSFELSYSLQLGLHAARNTGADAVIIFLADQPFVSSKLIDKIIAVYRESVLQEKQVEFITASYQGKPRPPVLFSNEMFSPLEKIHGDIGAREIIQANKDKGLFVPCNNALTFFDIDTPDDLKTLHHLLLHHKDFNR